MFKNRKNICIKMTVAAVLFAMLLSLTALGVSAEQSGTCGGDVRWTLSGYSLTIEGSGKMTDFTESEMAPWYQARGEIRRVTVSGGVTSIGALAFYDCGELASVIIPDTVESIGDFSFAKCKKLTGINGASALKYIGESAFEECEALASFRFPSTLTTISTRAFYRCYSLITITLPESVTSIGSSVFAYCSSLYTATINAALTVLPVWTFYGCTALTKVMLPATVKSIGEYNFHNCDNLSAICYSGSYEDGEKILEEVTAVEPEFPGHSFIYTDNYPAELPSVTTTENSSSTSTNVQTVTESDNSTIATTVTTTVPGTSAAPVTPGETPVTPAQSTTINAVIKNKDGWREVTERVIELEKTRADTDTAPIIVNVTLTDGTVIPEDVTNKLAETNSVINITSGDGSQISIVSKDIDPEGGSKSYDISHTVTPDAGLSDKQKEIVGDVKTYGLSFNDSIGFNFSSKVYLGADMANQTATLYQKTSGSKLEKLVSVVVDRNGYASFALASTGKDTDYVIAMNVRGESENAVIPNPVKSENGDMVSYQKTEYTITGVRKMFGMTIAQFSLAVIGFIVVIAVVIGAVMFMFYRSKRKFANSAAAKK